jgi:hypothetical protein
MKEHKKKTFLPRGLISLLYLDDNEASCESVPAPQTSAFIFKFFQGDFL